MRRECQMPLDDGGRCGKPSVGDVVVGNARIYLCAEHYDLLEVADGVLAGLNRNGYWFEGEDEGEFKPCSDPDCDICNRDPEDL